MTPPTPMLEALKRSASEPQTGAPARRLLEAIAAQPTLQVSARKRTFGLGATAGASVWTPRGDAMLVEANLAVARHTDGAWVHQAAGWLLRTCATKPARGLVEVATVIVDRGTPIVMPTRIAFDAEVFGYPDEDRLGFADRVRASAGARIAKFATPEDLATFSNWASIDGVDVLVAESMLPRHPVRHRSAGAHSRAFDIAPAPDIRRALLESCVVVPAAAGADIADAEVAASVGRIDEALTWASGAMLFAALEVLQFAERGAHP